MSSKTLITGATGLLGSQILKFFKESGWNVVGTGLSRAKPPAIVKLDLGDGDAISSLLDSEKPQVVVHCAANRFADKCDADPEAARAINVQATSALAHATNSRGILLIYISTDYVFPGTEGEAPYEADAATRPSNVYGQTKLDGEEATLKETTAKGLGAVLRVPVLYGHAGKPSDSAVNVLLDIVVQAGKPGAPPAVVDDWALRYPTNTEDVGRVCRDIAVKYLAVDDGGRASLPHVLHFSSEDRMTKYEMSAFFAEIMGVSMECVKANKQGNGPNASVQRPYDTHLSTKGLRDLGIDVYTQNFKDWWKREVGAFRH